MYIDLHTHSDSSDDSRANVEQYVKWIGVLRRKGFQVDGFVLTEHRKFDFDKNYTNLAKENDVLILKGSELDTDSGHFLVYGVSEELTKQIDFSDVHLNALDLVTISDQAGAIAIPAHPGRFGIGLIEFITDTRDFSGLKVAEQLNGSNRPGEQERAEDLLKKFTLKGTGGSDAHLVSAIGKCMTRFSGDIKSEQDLVSHLKNGTFSPVWLDDTRQE